MRVPPPPRRPSFCCDCPVSVPVHNRFGQGERLILITTPLKFFLWLLRSCTSIMFIIVCNFSMTRSAGPQLKVSSDTVTLTWRRGSNSGPLGTSRIHHADCFFMLLLFNVCGRAVVAYLKVVRRRKSSSADGTRGGEHERVTLPLVWGVRGSPPRKF